MKKCLILLFAILFAHCVAFAQTNFELKASQSMLMTGKGPGQDATINPYEGQDCYAIVENTGDREFSIRIQQRGKITETIPVLAGEVKKVTLLKGYELYLDSNSEGIANARVDYEKMEP
jgi:hypothetical protein